MSTQEKKDEIVQHLMNAYSKLSQMKQQPKYCEEILQEIQQAQRKLLML